MIFSEEALLVRYRFSVSFLPSPESLLFLPDIGFQKVSGLDSKTEIESRCQGGDNNSVYYLPIKTTYGNLILEKGRTTNLSILMNINNIFNSIRVVPINILITALNIKGKTASAWLIENAFPVRWSVSDLDAKSNEVIVDTLEFTYNTLKSITI